MAIIVRRVVNNSPSIKRVHGQYTGLQNEFVELMNTSIEDVDLDGWTIEDAYKFKHERKYRHRFKFQRTKHNTIIRARSYLTLITGQGVNDAYRIYLNRRAPIWNNAEDIAILRDASGQVVSELSTSALPIPPRPQPPPPIVIVETLPSTVSGRVVDSVCNSDSCRLPIANASLEFQKSGVIEKTATTNSQGYYTLNLIAGEYEVVVKADNYLNGTRTINVPVLSSITENFLLDPRIEIELGVDSTDIKFTRKEENLIEAVRRLTDNITVDINSDYTFTLNLSIRNGMTKRVLATLFEGNEEKSEREDTVCRTSDNLKTLSFTFSPVRHNWDWFRLTWFWAAEKIPGMDEKTFDYFVTLFGSYGNNWFNANRIRLGRITVRISREKLLYMDAYNKLLGAAWCLSIGAIAAIILAVVLLLPVLGVAVLGLTLTAAATATLETILGILGASLSFAWSIANSMKDAAYAAAKDPPEFDKDYRKLFKVNIKSKTLKADIKRFTTIRKAIVVSRNRLYSAHIKKNKKAIAKQAKNIQTLLRTNNSTVTRLSNYVKEFSRKIDRHKRYLSTNMTSRIRNAVRTNKVSEPSIISKLKRFGISKKEAEIALKIVKSKKIADRDLALPPMLHKLPVLMSKTNNLFIADIKKEIKWYNKI